VRRCDAREGRRHLLLHTAGAGHLRRPEGGSGCALGPALREDRGIAVGRVVDTDSRLVWHAAAAPEQRGAAELAHRVAPTEGGGFLRLERAVLGRAPFAVGARLGDLGFGPRRAVHGDAAPLCEGAGDRQLIRAEGGADQRHQRQREEQRQGHRRDRSSSAQISCEHGHCSRINYKIHALQTEQQSYIQNTTVFM
jgi:hypothetical protein